ncbi:MAG: hypothetical protein JRG83_03700 [Deltaproteobacteria bacterium]|nr:hypothetical protein [Deltaproteobacteria bacterium]
MAASSQVSVVYREFDNATLNSQNTISTTLQNQLTYQWNESHAFGGGFRYSTRDFETGVARDFETGVEGDLVDATTQTWEGFASWDWTIDARSTFNARVGPAFSSDDVDRGGPRTEFPKFSALVINFAGELVGAVRDPAGCPPENIRPGGIAFPEQCGVLDQADDTGFGDGITGAALDTLLGLTTTLTPEDAEDASGDNSNLFFSFGIDRNWERLRVQGSWTRSDSQTQSLGSNTVVDSVNLQSLYDLTPRMRFLGRFRYTRRTSELEREILSRLMSDTLEVIPEIPAGGAGLMGAPIIGFSVEDGSFDQTQESFNLQFRLVRDIGKSSSAFLGATMRRQITDLDSKIDLLDFKSTIDSWQFSMGFTYRFRPIRF